MIHYHGLPITPATCAVKSLESGHAFVSFRHADQLSLAIDICQSFAVDNGAFSAWMSGKPVTDWSGFYAWVDGLRKYPNFDWAVIPDVIDGDEDANDQLIHEWPFSDFIGVPVWHYHESIERLVRLATRFPRIALGSSGQFATIGTRQWWQRTEQVMDALCDDKGQPTCKLHGLRMLNPEVFSRLPLASADSCNIAMNIGIDSAWRGTYTPPTKEARALVIRQRIESINGATAFVKENHAQMELI